MNIRKKAWKAVLGTCFLWIFIHILVSVIDGLWDTNESADVAIILGSKVMENGDLSPRLEARVVAGLEAYKRGQVKKVLVSGGLGKEGHNEAEVRGSYLIAHDVAEKDVLIDPNGNTTALTAANSKQLMDAHGLETAIAVSHYFHLSRTKMACRFAGIEIVGGLHARMRPEWRELYSVPREFIGYYVYGVKGILGFLL